MAIIIEANYGKTIGLPGYSSHKFCVSVKSELQDPRRMDEEVSQLYAILQESVDKNIASPGYVPARNGDVPQEEETGSFKSSNNGQHSYANGKHGAGPVSRCSSKQMNYIESLARKENMRMDTVNQLCQKMFGKPVEEIDRMEASGLIDEIKQGSQPAGVPALNGKSASTWKGGRS